MQVELSCFYIFHISELLLANCSIAHLYLTCKLVLFGSLHYTCTYTLLSICCELKSSFVLLNRFVLTNLKSSFVLLNRFVLTNLKSSFVLLNRFVLTNLKSSFVFLNRFVLTNLLFSLSYFNHMPKRIQVW